MLKNAIAHVTREAPSRTQLHSVSWPQPKHREMQIIPFQPFWVQKRLREAALSWCLLQLALCPWTHCTHSLWLILQEMLTQALLRALCSCPGLQVLCTGAQPCCTSVTAGLLWVPSSAGLSHLPQGEMLSINVLCDQLPVLVWLLN